MKKPSRDMLTTKMHGGIATYSYSKETKENILKPLSHFRGVQKILDLNQPFYDRDDLVLLLYIPFCHSLPENKLNSSVILKLQFAYDLLLKLEGFEDIEHREKNGRISVRYFSDVRDKYHLSATGRINYAFKEKARRAMGIFIHNYSNYKRRYHKTILLKYFEEGLTMEAIGKQYQNKKGVKKTVSKVAIFYIINYYRQLMIKHMRYNPDLYKLESDELTQEIWDNSPELQREDEDES